MNRFNHRDGRYFSVGDTDIYVEETGNPDGFPVVFLHGGLGTIEDFHPLVDKIPDTFRGIGIDSRGHGKSGPGSRKLSYEQLEHDIARVLSSLQVARCAVIGFSDGGIIACRLAISHPDWIAGIATIGADWNPPGPDIEHLFQRMTPEGWQQKFPGTVSLYETLNPDPNFSHFMESVIAMWLDRSASGYPGHRVRAIRCETLIMRGHEDIFLPLEALSHLDEDFPHATWLNVPFAGHDVHVKQPEIVGPVVNQFLKRCMDA